MIASSVGVVARAVALAATCTMSTMSIVAPPASAQTTQTPAITLPNSVAVAPSSALAQNTLSRLVTVQLDRVSLGTAVRKIAESARVRVQFQNDVFDGIDARVTLHVTRLPLGVALDRTLEGTALHVAVLDSDLVAIKSSSQVSKSAGVVSGRVTDAATTRPLVGARVSLDDSPRAVETDADGHYKITGVVVGDHNVRAKMIGYARSSQHVTATADAAATANFTLSKSTQTLDQVVVTGTVVATELKAIPNAITVITAKELEQRGITRIDQLFRGDVPGLFAWRAGSEDVLGQVEMFSRGATALSDVSAGTSINSNPIKTYVDGVEMADATYLTKIDPKSIERIEILTGPQASTIYGSNALNGVMQIFTKRGAAGAGAPELRLSLSTGWIENDLSSAHTPQHDDDAQVSGAEGRLSYNAGVAWNYTGRWSPGSQAAITSAFGGTHFALPTRMGGITTDLSFRKSVTQSSPKGDAGASYTNAWASGLYKTGGFGSSVGVGRPTTYNVTSQTLGFTVTYAPVSWWSHEASVGEDQLSTNTRVTSPSYNYVGDTSLFLSEQHEDRRSLRYTTTAHVPMASIAQATVTAGVDGWQRLGTTMSAYNPSTLDGTITGTTYITRTPDHNTGAFIQSQLGMFDRLFLTYGLRAEWNPSFGDAVRPNYAPRYGVAYTADVGALTAKLRLSYGRSTRPPQATLKTGIKMTDTWNGDLFKADYGDIYYSLPNPDLGPEFQQGGEGGLELYLGSRASLVVTHYNQTVDGLIYSPYADSARSLHPIPVGGLYFSRDAQGYGYVWQYQYLNIGSIRNQGWELRSTVTTGPLTTTGTYSWTKSRSLGVTPKYQHFFTSGQCGFCPQFERGATFEYLPEHTWAMDFTYAHAGTTVGLHVSGVGQFRKQSSAFYNRYLSYNLRLQSDLLNTRGYGALSFDPGYALSDLNASHRLSSHVESILQVQNVTNYYSNDFDETYASMGRQTKVGLRVTFK